MKPGRTGRVSVVLLFLCHGGSWSGRAVKGLMCPGVQPLEEQRAALLGAAVGVGSRDALSTGLGWHSSATVSGPGLCSAPCCAVLRYATLRRVQPRVTSSRCPAGVRPQP